MVYSLSQPGKSHRWIFRLFIDSVELCTASALLLIRFRGNAIREVALDAGEGHGDEVGDEDPDEDEAGEAGELVRLLVVRLRSTTLPADFMLRSTGSDWTEEDELM